jgi:hypothetical protein
MALSNQGDQSPQWASIISFWQVKQNASQVPINVRIAELCISAAWSTTKLGIALQAFIKCRAADTMSEFRDER